MNFRIARHTFDFEPIIKFYIDILGLELLGKFENHNNYDGIFIGKSNANWHLEFTKSNQKADHKFDPDDLLVFYPQTLDEYNKIIDCFKENNVHSIKPKNPYWLENGVTYLDPDNHRIVISNCQISNS